MKNKEIRWGDLSIGDSYLYEERYYLQCIIKISQDYSDKDYYKYKLKIKKILGGVLSNIYKEGDSFVVGKYKNNISENSMVGKFKTDDSITTYYI